MSFIDRLKPLATAALFAATPAFAVIVGPANFNSLDIGSGVGGSTTYNTTTSTYTMKAAGSDIEGTSDNFLFLHQSLTGDGQVSFRVDALSSPVDWSKVGVMVRQDLNANSANAFFFMRPSLGSAGQVRVSTGAGTNSTWQENPAENEDFTQTNPYRTRYLKPAKWLSAVRKGTTITTYSSDDGKCWNLRTKETISLTGTALMGVALTGHDSTTKATATISNLSIKNSAPADINVDCPRAQKDGNLAAPTSWIINRTNPVWAISTTNPDTIAPLRTCLSGDNPFRKTKGRDSPMCPLEQITHAWAKTGYIYNSNWMLNKTSQVGNGLGGINAPTIWLRGEVNLTQTQINRLMLWGKWNNSVSIYVNGMLATNTYRSNLAGEYHYLGLNDSARAALKVGNNVIAVRVECFDENKNPSSTQSDLISNCSNASADFGLAQHSALAALPQNTPITGALGTKERTQADIFSQYTKEMGALGGTFAAYRNNILVEQRNLGWADKKLTTLASNPIMRLASVDKRVTDAVIVHLYNRGILHPHSKVFSEILNITPMPNRTWGQNVREITVEHLRTNTSGLTAIGGLQGWQDEIAFRFGVSTADLKTEHLARVYASYDACDWEGGYNCSILPGQGYAYSSNGFALLRYIAEQVTNMSIEAILAEMGTNEIKVSHEVAALRPARETGYMIVNRETRARWVELDQYLALSASASGLARFFIDRGADFDAVTFLPKSGGQGGAMDGTRSFGGADPATKSGSVGIWNSDYAGSKRFDDLQAIKMWNVKIGNCDPTSGAATDRYRLHSYWAGGGDKFLNIEPINGQMQLHTSHLGNNGWESAKWKFELEIFNGQPVYRISNAWQANHYMQATGTQADAAVISAPMPATRGLGLWKVIKSGDYSRLENVQAPGSFLHIENGNPRIRNYPDAMHSTRWYVCS